MCRRGCAVDHGQKSYPHSFRAQHTGCPRNIQGVPSCWTRNFSKSRSDSNHRVSPRYIGCPKIFGLEFFQSPRRTQTGSKILYPSYEINQKIETGFKKLKPVSIFKISCGVSTNSSRPREFISDEKFSIFSTVQKFKKAQPISKTRRSPLMLGLKRCVSAYRVRIRRPNLPTRDYSEGMRLKPKRNIPQKFIVDPSSWVSKDASRPEESESVAQNPLYAIIQEL